MAAAPAATPTPLIEAVEVDFGVEKSGAQVGVTEHIGNRLERMALAQHPGCEAVAKGMFALAGCLDTG